MFLRLWVWVLFLVLKSDPFSEKRVLDLSRVTNNYYLAMLSVHFWGNRIFFYWICLLEIWEKTWMAAVCSGWLWPSSMAICGVRHCSAFSSSALIPLIWAHWTPLSFILALLSALLSICCHLLHPLMVSTSFAVAAAPSAPPHYLQSHEPRPFMLEGCVAIATEEEWRDSKNLRIPSKGWLLTPPPLRQ